MKPADPLTLPLTGVSLVEASAGTGKTTALVHTYLRALLTTELTVDKLLVVTFTRAATGELTTRIRKRLGEAHAALTGKAEPDELLARLLAHADAGDDLLLRRVRAAFTALDDSAVFTIHGFCQRMLADLAFETGGAFTTEQREEEQSLKEEIAADFWRRRQVEASPAYAKWLLDAFKTRRGQGPGGLLEKLRDALAVSGGLRVGPRVTMEQRRRAETAFDAAAAEAVERWRASRDELTKFLEERPGVNRTTYSDKAVTTLLAQWERWVVAPTVATLPDKFELLTIETLSGKMNKGHEPPDDPFFAAAQKVHDTARALEDIWWQETFASALDYLQTESRARKRQAREIGFDDMLENLREALEGPGGEALAERIAERFPLALVDEFQDTDPHQYAIFSRIYGGRKDAGLILIGDPKQAIYRFRGADVFTYMRARRECEANGRIFSLARNFRTTGALIGAVNTLFGEAAQPAFRYEQIPFVAVEPGRAIAPLETGTEDAPLTVVWREADKDTQDGVDNKGDAEAALAGVCAAEIERLLVLGEDGKARYNDMPVRARDVAVLVSMHRQGEAVKQALHARGIASVTLSNDSVFETDEATDMETLLAAVAAPASGSRLRRALATPLLGRTARQIAELGDDEEGWSALVSAFRAYNQYWQTQGFSAMFAHLLREQRIIERTLARDDGERAMTNLRHLAELAETHAAHHPGIESLMAWLARERAEVHRGDESRELRLESDAELVRIVTVHKSKGLEYPVVFLPFLWDARKPASSNKHPAVLAHDADLEPVLDLGSEHLEARGRGAREEQSAEQVRLAYVALTRAAHACYLLAAPAKYVEHSALAGLLGVGGPGGFEEALRQWFSAAPAGAMHFRAPLKAARGLKAAGERPHGEAREFAHAERLHQRFHIASYSLLAAGAGSAMAERPDWDEAVQAAPVVETAAGIHAFPAGPASGTFLHALLEKIDFAEPGEHEATVRRMCAEYGFGDQGETLLPWLTDVLATPLDPAGCTLADIARPRRRDEMEFYFPIENLEADRLDDAVSQFAPQGPRPRLNFKDVAGQMKGYIDLVFEYDGRYWIVDYKSNRLGSDAAAYTPAALDHAMAEHRYDLQYLVYTVALHRHLPTRIADYDYEKHFGGVMYLFLRGMEPGAPAPRGVWHTRPGYADIQRLDALLGGRDV